MDLNDKVAVITGGASGLGRATAEAYIAKGAKVALFDLNEELAANTAAELGDAAAAFTVNVAEEESVQTAIAGVMERFGAIHVNVNCAGIGAAARTLGRDGAMPLATFNFVIGVNLIGTFNTLRLCAEQMAKNEPVNEDAERGVIINTASVAAFDGQIGQAAYSASKGGVVGLTLPVARDLSAIGIRVNCVAPGLIDTPIYGQGEASEKFKENLGRNVLFPKRLGFASELASMVAECITNDYMNAETLRVDGGIRMPPK